MKTTHGRILAALLLTAPVLAIAPTAAQASQRCGATSQYAFNDAWRGSLCTQANGRTPLTRVSLSAGGGFPTFSGCQVYARWWSPNNTYSANSAWMTCSYFYNNLGGAYSWDYSSNPRPVGVVQICGTFIFKNTGNGQYWGPAQAVCVDQGSQKVANNN